MIMYPQRKVKSFFILSFYCNSFSLSGKNPDHPENELQFFIAGSEKQKKKHRCDPASVLLHETGLVGEAPVSNKSGLAVVAGSPPGGLSNIFLQNQMCRSKH